MTLNEAIKILTRQNAGRIPALGDKRREATALGIEALKRIDYCRKHNVWKSKEKLPGETAEQEVDKRDEHRKGN